MNKPRKDYHKKKISIDIQDVYQEEKFFFESNELRRFQIRIILITCSKT
jgi:hypothetical protein